MQERKTAFQQIDFTLLFLLFLLMCISFLAVYSASGQYFPNDPTFFLRRQVVWYGIGVVLMVGAMSIDYDLFRNFSIPFYGLGIFLLLLVALFGIEQNGAQRWLGHPDFLLFQPSEFVKIFVVLALAHYLYHISQRPRPKTFKEDCKLVGSVLVIGLPPFVLILEQPDLGTALVVGAVILTMILMAGVTWRMIGLIVGTITVGIGFLVWLHNNFFEFFTNFINTHQLNRIYAWLDPYNYPTDIGYQLIHALQGIGAGQLYGSGFTEGVKSQSGAIPEIHTDFIFTVIAEEFGFFGATVLIVIYFLMFYRMIIIAFTCNNTFGTYLVSGTVGLLVFQVFQNIGMAVGVMPITGLALPFISYGGSALITNMIAIGIVLNVNMRTKHYMFGKGE
ncbi:rod shape-determining protein RodA [Texcoconibacillus texcoconensis]|uniref:Rod shape-determining protein RodA n=1 Tax=Texcoconibacillus texcoconensis TaxID=1095777 RepID=A0A840QN46_9BACI|nr:rod shape-determining protein RodA [Texcoconibacillus texcoconensis]MBB5172805.1 rod shape-determining protein RodA [Texcoconibacillus texcoconensis]